MRKSDPDLTPLPKWKQRRAALVAWWRRTKNQRQRAYKSFKSTASKALTLAISVLGGTLISFGVYSVYPPAGYAMGGLICWFLQWSHEQDKRRHE